MEGSLESVTEIKITVPWGHIAGKAWGDERNTAVLVFHGILDNAGSFDHLIPLLPNSFYYICFDLPGHGLSSHFPPHLPIYTTNYLVVYKIIVEHFNRKHYIIMGHSYGGQIAFTFTQLYPHFVEKLIMLDTISSFPILTEQFKSYLIDKFDSYFLTEQKLVLNEEPTYTYDEALNKIQLGRHYGALSVEAATALIRRAIVPVENGKYKFTMDQRLKHFINPLSDFHYIAEVMKKHPVTCPVLIVLGTESDFQQNFMKPLIKILRSWRNVSIKMANGSHDVHNISPENVAPFVSKFLLHKKGKL